MSLRPRLNAPNPGRGGDGRRQRWSESPIPRVATRRVRMMGNEVVPPPTPPVSNWGFGVSHITTGTPPFVRFNRLTGPTGGPDPTLPGDIAVVVAYAIVEAGMTGPDAADWTTVDGGTVGNMTWKVATRIVPSPKPTWFGQFNLPGLSGSSPVGRAGAYTWTFRPQPGVRLACQATLVANAGSVTTPVAPAGYADPWHTWVSVKQPHDFATSTDFNAWLLSDASNVQVDTPDAYAQATWGSVSRMTGTAPYGPYPADQPGLVIDPDPFPANFALLTLGWVPA